MSVDEPPAYSISGFLLGSLLFAAAVSALIWAAHGYFTGRYFDAMKPSRHAYATDMNPLRSAAIPRQNAIFRVPA